MISQDNTRKPVHVGDLVPDALEEIKRRAKKYKKLHGIAQDDKGG